MLKIGAKRYADEENLFSYKNCVIAERDREVMGMMLTFPIAPQTSQMMELSPHGRSVAHDFTCVKAV